MLAERGSSKNQNPNFSADGRALVFVYEDKNKITLECPGVLVSQIEKPLTPQKRDEFAQTARANALRNKTFMMKNGKLRAKLLERLNVITQTRIVRSVDVFCFQRTKALDPKKYFDIAGKKTF